jgi:hypothetical protein
MNIARWILVVATLLVLATFAIFGFLEARDKRRAERGVPPVHDHLPRREMK